MFEQELREEQRSLQSLSNEIRQIISRYDTRLRDLRKQFDKVNGTAEKQIGDMLNEFNNNISSVLKEFEKQIDKELQMHKNSICEQEVSTMKYLREYKERCVKEYLLKIKSIMTVKGES